MGATPRKGAAVGIDILVSVMTPQLGIIVVFGIVLAILAYLDRSGASVREEEFDASTGRIRQRRS